MHNPTLNDLLKPPGRTPRARFIFALGIVVLSVLAQSYVASHTGRGLAAFYLSLFWMGFNLYLLFTVFARRLHDVNLSSGLFFSAIFLTLLTVCVTFWVGGGGDYMQTLMDNPALVEDEAAFGALTQSYQENLRAHVGMAKLINLLPFTTLALFCALKPSSPKANRYGAPAQKIPL